MWHVQVHHCSDFNKSVWCLLSRPKSQNTGLIQGARLPFSLVFCQSQGWYGEGMLCLNVDIPMIFFLITKPAIKIPQFAQGMNRVKLLSSWANRWRKLENDHDLTEFWKALSFTTIISWSHVSWCHIAISKHHIYHILTQWLVVNQYVYHNDYRIIIYHNNIVLRKKK